MEDIVLDTTVIIDHLKRRPETEAVQIFHAIREGILHGCTTSITAFEVYRGARCAPHPEQRLAEAKALFTHMTCLAFDKTSAGEASEISVTLEKRGRAMEIRDLLIGAIARAQGLPLITSDVEHFSRIPRLKVETPGELLARLKRVK